MMCHLYRSEFENLSFDALQRLNHETYRVNFYIIEFSLTPSITYKKMVATRTLKFQKGNPCPPKRYNRDRFLLASPCRKLSNLFENF